MRKAVLFLVIITLAAGNPVFAESTTSHGAVIRPWSAMGRGLANLAGLPAEIITTGLREGETHTRLWPVTYFPRLVGNLFTRAASGIYDIVFFPFYAPFTDDLSPLTEGMGLPEYPWQK